jgi:hypothetical protein
VDELAPWLRAQVRLEREDAHQARGLLGIETAWWTVPNLRARGLTRGDAMHIARNAPLARIADCDAKLKVLDFHDLSETWERAEGKPLKQAEVLRIVVRQLGGAYRHLPGYLEKWE